jgi:CDP-paratose 2-epimerase
MYGQRQFGHEDQGWVAHFAWLAMRGATATLFGSGEQVRDLLYVDDACRAFEAAVERRKAVAGQVFNLGGGPSRAERVIDVAEMLGLDVTFAAPRLNDPPWYVSDTRKADRLLDWCPTVSVDEGLERMLQWCESETPTRAA